MIDRASPAVVVGLVLCLVAAAATTLLPVRPATDAVAIPSAITPLSSTGPGNTSNGSGIHLGYTVVFLAQDLPGGTPWSVTLGFRASSSASSSIVFSNVSSGEYRYQISAPSGYSASPGQGTVQITQNAHVLVSFASTGAQPTFGGWPPSALEISLILLILVLGTGAIIGNEWRERRRRRKAARGGPPTPAPELGPDSGH